MAEKKRKKQPRRSAGPQPDNMIPFAHPRAAMEGAMADIGKLLQGQQFASAEEANAFLQEIVAGGQLNLAERARPASERTPLEQAQNLMYEAWEAPPKRAVALARRALEISPDCADAYVALAELTARSAQEARDFYEQAVRAGERALGPEAFEQDAGHFWGVLETRPYMRARAGLAEILWLTGERPQAIEHYREMLRLNPNDNQGIRYTLINCLLLAGSNADVEKLLHDYEDDYSATWLYSRALLAFRREGPGKTANGLLKEAIAHNRFVPQYLLGEKEPPEQMPDFIGFGDENEAADYIAGALAVWLSHPDAVAWVAAQTAKQPGKGRGR